MSRRRACIASLALVLTMTVGVVARADTTTDEREFEVRLLEYIDAFRENKGVDAINEHEFIRDQAREHSDRMALEGVLTDVGNKARARRIEANDSGISRDEICENYASASVANIQIATQKVFRAWKQSYKHRRCMLGRPFSTESGAVGAQYDQGKWWVTFIGAHDESP